MSPLPWLLVHGPAVWPIAVAAAALGAVALAFARARLRARRAAAAARDRLGAPRAALDGAADGLRVTFAGQIEAEGELCQRFEDGSTAAAASAAYAPSARGGAFITGLNVRADKLALWVGDVLLPLEGQVEVVAGSREVHRGQPLGRMPAAVQKRIEAGFKLGPPHFRDRVTVLRSVASGDGVRVSGVLRREAPGGGAGYRASAERWALVPDGDGEATGGLRVAFEGAPAVRGPLGRAYAGYAVGGGLLALALAGLGGEIAYGEIATGQALSADAGMTATAIAAATPFRRRDAVEVLADALDRRHDEDGALIERRAALHELRGDCTAAAKALARQGQLERGAEIAARCGDPAFAAKAFYAAGDFVRASDAWEHVDGGAGDVVDARFGVRVHLLAGRTALAAKRARVLAEKLAPPPGMRGAEVTPSRAALARCLADALDARDGDAAALARLRGDPGQPIYPACAILLADLHRGQARVDIIQGLTSFQASGGEVPMAWLEELVEEANPTMPAGEAPDIFEHPSLLVINPSRAIHGMLPGVERALAEALAHDDPAPSRASGGRAVVRMRAAVRAATFAAVAGDHREARRFAGLAAASADPEATPQLEVMLGAWGAARAAAFAGAVELAAGDVSRAEELLVTARRIGGLGFTEELDALARYRSERAVEPLAPFYDGWRINEEGVAHALAAAAAGDGAALGEILRRPSVEVGAYLSLGAPLVLTAQHDVLRWIRLGYRMPGWFRAPADQLVHWAELASAAAALGDPTLAAQLSERAGRFRAALLRRELAVPLAVLERL